MKPCRGALHVEIYRRPGAFAGWPANYGLWNWGDEVVCVFAVGRLGTPDGSLHLEDSCHPFKPAQARSFDGGLTWEVEAFNAAVPGRQSLSADEHVVEDLKAGGAILPDRDLRPMEEPVDFLTQGSVILAARTGIRGHPLSWFYVSHDRARSWEGPFAFHGLEVAGGIAARTDIVVLGKRDALFLLTTTEDGEEGKVFCARTADGGCTFRFQAYLGRGRRGSAIMPASVRLDDGTVFTAVRRNDERRRGWIDAYRSFDEGRTWTFAGRPVADTGYMGNPPALTRLGDDLILTYGYRAPPFGIRAIASSNGGLSWSDPMIVRGDGGGPDLGYPRTIARADGTLLAVYYFNRADTDERFIAASVFQIA